MLTWTDYFGSRNGDFMNYNFFSFDFFSLKFLKVLEQIRTPFLDLLFYFITYGGEEVTLLAALCILFWCVDQKYAYRLAFSFFCSAMAIHMIKLTLRIPRPWVRDPGLTVVERAKASATGYSFPSGHTQTSTSLFGTLLFNTKKKWIMALSLLAILLVMFSRMYMGVHTPADVGVSFALSLLIVLIVNKLIDTLELTPGKRMAFAIGLSIFAVCACSYSIYLYFRGLIPYSDMSDCCKGGAAGIGFALCWYLETMHIRFKPRAASFSKQVIKFLLGLGGVLLLKSGLKILLGTSVYANMFRYFAIMIWAMLIMPLIIRKFFTDAE